ncbi:MAG TPA: hypothetical protein VHB01_09215 [Nitrosospira sp.]|nr:hypothetical protein [Nitrosospira sp.]
MKTEHLTDEATANPAPKEIEVLENASLTSDEQMAKDEPKQEEQRGVANDAGEDEPIVHTKNGKGIIPYEKHKALRVENSALREQLQAVQLENRKAAEKLEALLKQKNENAGGMDGGTSDEALAKHLEKLEADMPEVHQIIAAVLEGSRKQGEKLEKTLNELRSEREASARARQLTVEEQIAEAKDNNPDLVHWESNDPSAWEEALKQDEILRTSSGWAGKPFSERFEEVARRVKAIMPEVSIPKQTDPERTKADVRTRLENAPARKPITLSDIQGGANPASERDQIENLSPHELARRLMKMPSQQAAALRADLD